MLKTILAFGAMAAAVVSSVRDLTLTRSVHSKLFHPVNVPYVFDKIDVDLNVFKTEHLRGLTKKHDNKEPRHKKKEPDDDDDYSLIFKKKKQAKRHRKEEEDYEDDDSHSNKRNKQAESEKHKSVKDVDDIVQIDTDEDKDANDQRQQKNKKADSDISVKKDKKVKDSRSSKPKKDKEDESHTADYSDNQDTKKETHVKESDKNDAANEKVSDKRDNTTSHFLVYGTIAILGALAIIVTLIYLGSHDTRGYSPIE
jgi:hypothetical protein